MSKVTIDDKTIDVDDCPFCRSPEVGFWKYLTDGCCVICKKCHARGPKGAFPEIAAGKWNKPSPTGDAATGKGPVGLLGVEPTGALKNTVDVRAYR